LGWVSFGSLTVITCNKVLVPNLINIALTVWQLWQKKNDFLNRNLKDCIFL